MRQPYDPQTLRLFLTVCEEGSIVRCAERECTVPSAVSKRMAALEERAGMQLLRRGARGMEPTDAGLALARQAREVLASLERMQSTTEVIASGGEGSVRILASLAALSSSLPADMVKVLRKHRSIKVSLKQASSAEMVKQVREGSADLAVCWDVADLTGLAALPYRCDHACAIVPANHPLALRKSVRFVEVLAYDYISAMPGSMMETKLHQYAGAAGMPMAPRIEVQSFDGVARVVAAGLGVSVLPREVIEPLANSLALRIVPLADAWSTRQFVICFREEPYVSRAALAIANGLKQ
ncbi:LysR family transcriptional regulator [Variovorax paradoxus]|uniref:LysR family transcriptional regulator n=1 Tax=Variovorax paradoxus TaxID=34073 RepID=UPI003ECD5980